MLRVNLIFQGGGVKGVAFAGALDALENSPPLRGSVEVAGVGGVSVGAITAALYAAGYTAQNLKDELYRISIASLLPEHSPGAIRAMWRLWKQKGLYSTSRIYDWIRGLLEQKGVHTFGELKRPCRILAANVTDGVYQMFSEKDFGQDVASAVLKSLSIPLFFTPYIDGQRLFVDGGLLSNYPLWLFQDSPLPTVGIKLLGHPWRGATPASGLLEYFMSLLSTMVGAHDRVGRGAPPDVAEIQIDASFVEGTNFEVEDRDQDLLYARGKAAVASFDWSRVRPPAPIIFRGPNAALILEDTATSIHKVIDRAYARPGDRAYDYFRQIYVVTEEGHGEAEEHFLLRNVGTTPITVIRHIMDYDHEVDVSFRDLALEATCGPAPNEIVTLPLRNTRLSKWYALWFIPPISPGEFREVKVKKRVPYAFVRYARGERDEITMGVEHESEIRQASLIAKVHKRLGRLRVMQEWGATVKQTFGEQLAGTGEDYHSYVWTFGPSTSPLDFKVRIEKG